MGDNRLRGKRIFVGFNNAGSVGAYSFTRFLKEKGINIDFWGFSGNWVKDPVDVAVRNYRNFFLRKIQGLILLIYALFKYDVFHFYSRGTFFQYKIDFFLIKLFRKKIVVDFRGSDAFDVVRSVNREGKDSPYYQIYKDRGPAYFQKRDGVKRFIIGHADAIVLAGPWLVDSVSRYDSIIPYSRDIDQIRSYKKDYSNKEFTVLHAPTNSGIKGSKYLFKAIDELKDRGLKVRLVNPGQIAREDLFDLINRSDVVVDQLLLGWYGGFAVEAMALGKPVICFLKGKYKKLVPFGKEIPVINANKDNVDEVIEKLIGNKNKLEVLGKRGYKFVKRFHDAKVVAPQYEDIYNKVLDL